MPSAARARSNRWARSVSSSCSARARASRTPDGGAGDLAALEPRVVLDAETGERGDLAAPQAGHAAGCRWSGGPTWSGVMRARRVVRNSRTSARLSTPSSLGRADPGRSHEGCPVSTPIDRDFQPDRAAGSLDVVGRWPRGWARNQPDESDEEEHARCVGVVMYGPGDVRVEDREDPKIIEPTDAIIRLSRDLHLRQRPVALPRRRAGRPPGDGPRVRRRRRGDRLRGPQRQGRRLRRRLVLGLRQHLRDLPGRLPGVLRAPRPDGHARHPVRAGPHPARRRHAGGDPGAARRRPHPLPDGRLRRARHRLVRRGRRRGRARARPSRSSATARSGCIGVLAAKQLGAERIIAFSRHADRQALAREFGATDIVEERGEDGVARRSRSSPAGSAPTRSSRPSAPRKR